MREAGVVLLTGASAVGKTATALALQALLSSSVYLPREAAKVRAAGATALSTEAALELERRLLDSYLAALLAYGSRGWWIIGETILASADWVLARAALASVPSLIVRLVAPLELLVEREHVRATTHPGTATATFRRAHLGGDPDLELDASTQSPEELAAVILLQFQARHL